MNIKMVKKRLIDGSECKKCQEVEALLKTRKLTDKISQRIWFIEDDSESEGAKLSLKHNIKLAPFFLVTDNSGKEIVFTSVLKLIKTYFPDKAKTTVIAAKIIDPSALDLTSLSDSFKKSSPAEIITWGLENFGSACALAFSGAEDVALIDLAAKSGLDFNVFTLDTGRLHPATLRFIEKVRDYYSLKIMIVSPAPDLLEPMVEKKGLFSFYPEGHRECCGIRKVKPLRRALANFNAWMTGQRKDQNPATRSDLKAVEADTSFKGKSDILIKINPFASWNSQQVWNYIRENKVPYNKLHDQGYHSIGCEPCTRAARPGEPERNARWWWENAETRECGLHLKK